MSDDEWWILPEWAVFHCFQCNVSCRGGVELRPTLQVLRIYGGGEGHVGLKAESNTRINI